MDMSTHGLVQVFRFSRMLEQGHFHGRWSFTHQILLRDAETDGIHGTEADKLDGCVMNEWWNRFG